MMPASTLAEGALTVLLLLVLSAIGVVVGYFVADRTNGRRP